jgi:hypothetical protein
VATELLVREIYLREYKESSWSAFVEWFREEYGRVDPQLKEQAVQKGILEDIGIMLLTEMGLSGWKQACPRWIMPDPSISWFKSKRKEDKQDPPVCLLLVYDFSQLSTRLLAVNNFIVRLASLGAV